MNETEIRIIIDRLLRRAGWRLPGDNSPNVRAGQRIGGDKQNLEADYVLENQQKSPLAVLEAKRSDISPLAGKEQARQYAEKLHAPFVILSNGSEHYFWQIARHEPIKIAELPTAAELLRRADDSPPQSFDSQTIDKNYIADAQGKNCPPHKRRHMRDYQIAAVVAVQKAAADNRRAFLLEMATGTGKTLVSAAAIKLFLSTGNARRILFLVDRLELETQAKNNFEAYLGNSWQTLIYKTNNDDWNRANIVVSTVQSLINKYKQFSPLDFDLIIVDEAHRAIHGRRARKVFDYFCAYKLGLTATPKHYLRGVNKSGTTPKEYEARQLRDTYHTFGCEEGEPTYGYDLKTGAAAKHLIMPRIIDARTTVTTDMLSEHGFSFGVETEEEKQQYFRENFEQNFFSPATNKAICRAFMEYALKDPLSGDIGKTLVYCVSQRHAAKIAKEFNELAAAKFPNKYNSDFALQITSSVPGAQEYTRQFANNNLSGKTRALEDYDSAKTRICVTVGMMTTGYDCPDILNICLMRPIFSPSEFIQMRGRGTRPHRFFYDGGGGNTREDHKTTFMLFDFFAVCEYFEKECDYDEKLSIYDRDNDNSGDIVADPEKREGAVIYTGGDEVNRMIEILFADGMRIDQLDRQQQQTMEDKLLADDELRRAIEDNDMQKAEELCKQNHAEEMDNLQKLSAQHAKQLDRRVNIGEVLQLIFEVSGELKNREDLMDEETDKFINQLAANEGKVMNAAAEVFKACLDDNNIRDIVEAGEFARLADNPVLSPDTCGQVPKEIRQRIINHIKTKVNKEIFTPQAA